MRDRSAHECRAAQAVAAVALAVTVSCTPAGPKPEQTADAIYTGGDIVTVNDAQPTVEALAVKDGKILAVGARADVEKAHKGSTTRVVDLGGKTLMPELPRRAQPLHQLADGGQPGERLRAAGRAGQGHRQHRRRAQEIPRGEEDPGGRDDPGLRLRRERHAERQAAEPRSARQGLPGQPRAGRARVDARRGAELGRAAEAFRLRRTRRPRPAASSSASPARTSRSA